MTLTMRLRHHMIAGSVTVAGALVTCTSTSAVTVPPQSVLIGFGLDAATVVSERYAAPEGAIVPTAGLGYQLNSRLRAEVEGKWWQREFDDLSGYEFNKVKWTAWNVLGGASYHPSHRRDGFLVRGSIGFGHFRHYSSYWDGVESTKWATTAGCGYEFGLQTGALAGLRADWYRQGRDFHAWSVGLRVALY